MLHKNKIYCGDCIDVMKYIENDSIDMILCDLPYGITGCKWDAVIPIPILWESYKRVIKKGKAIVLTASQPFTSLLVSHAVKNLKHHWVWDKGTGTGFQVAKYRPMMQTEDVLVFTQGGEKVVYYPQMVKLDKPLVEKFASSKSGSSPIAHLNKGERYVTHRYPKNILTIKRDKDRVHPTQKPVALFEYLIKTYSKEGDLILDNCAGSGTTGVACKNLGRDFILIEKDEKYCKIIGERVDLVYEIF